MFKRLLKKILKNFILSYWYEDNATALVHLVNNSQLRNLFDPIKLYHFRKDGNSFRDISMGQIIQLFDKKRLIKIFTEEELLKYVNQKLLSEAIDKPSPLKDKIFEKVMNELQNEVAKIKLDKKILDISSKRFRYLQNQLTDQIIKFNLDKEIFFLQKNALTSNQNILPINETQGITFNISEKTFNIFEKAFNPLKPFIAKGGSFILAMIGPLSTYFKNFHFVVTEDRIGIGYTFESF